ncbi:hypothetical protein IAQ61_001378 [Plenodomus lingam]|uniref:uncharacterized protein n=1 Tax=Leptosphaeria maculans TaxID=5022 RepID=UPI0033167A44|nr:hypothetical protein IAQ61_001378 [Plenodomus lingam]
MRMQPNPEHQGPAVVAGLICSLFRMATWKHQRLPSASARVATVEKVQGATEPPGETSFSSTARVFSLLSPPPFLNDTDNEST